MISRISPLHKKHTFFFQMFWKDGDPKKIALEYDLVLSGKIIFLFPEYLILIFRWKMKDDLSQKKKKKKKKKRKFGIFFKCCRMIIFPKIITQEHGNTIYLVLSGKMIFIFSKNIILFYKGEMKGHISQKNTWKYYSLRKPFP